MSSSPGGTLEETISFPSAAPSEVVDEPRIAQARQAAWIARALRGAPVVDAPVLSLRPGDPIPGTRYVIERWLGEGGMGVVYEARHVDIDRRVALKVLRAEYCTRTAVMQAFRDEARIVSRIGSEHIAEVYDFVELPDGRLLFVMELLRGVTLSRALLEARFDASRAIAVLRQVCKAIAAAHAVDVVHRDLKPDNIVLGVHRGREDFVKVLDFGIAIVMSEAGVATHAAAGTPSYLAPEAILGQPFDARLDIYALGCTAYEMLNGRPPFDSENVQSVLRGQLEEAPIPLADLRPDLPASLCAVVMRCLAKSRDARYPDMVELEAALCEAQIEARVRTSWDDLALPELEPARRDALLRRMPDPRGRTRSRVRPGTKWAVAATLALLVAAGVWALRRDDDAGRAPIDALSLAAYEAAARSYYVYPPPDAPDESTAFGVIIELEQREDELGGAALDEAARLREEFAATLVRLGDEYWEREGGQPFAIDYYAEALVFAPDHGRAASRAILTPGQLASLRDKAEKRTFSAAELIAAEPLIALADPDPLVRQQKVAALRRNRRTRAATTNEGLALLAADASGGTQVPTSPTTAPPLVGPQPTPAPVAAADVVALPELAPPKPVRDPKAVAALVDEGNRARDRGRLDAARRAFEGALALDANSHAAIIGLSDVEFHAGQYARAATLARKAVRLAPRNAAYRLRLGDAYFKAFRYADARVEYGEAQRLGSTAAEGRIAKVDAKSR